MTAQTAIDYAGPAGIQRVTLLRGEALASGDSSIEYSTVLGSCISTCLYEPKLRIGGMNHFLLAQPAHRHQPADVDEHYGVFLMELLINKMLALGASKSRLKARLYGGANMHQGLQAIGSANAQFAKEFLQREGITLTFADLEGHAARRVRFRPASGLVRCTNTIPEQAPPAFEPTAKPPERGDVELF